MQKLAFIKKLSIFMLLAIGVAIYAFAQPAQQQQPLPIGQVVWVKGEVKDISTVAGPRVLKRRDAIYLHDELDTNSTSSCEIVFTDGQLLTVTNGSVLHLDNYKFSKENPSDNKFVADLVKGGFRAITGAISKANPESYKVNTPVATIGVRGTDFSIHYKSCTADQKDSDCGLSARIEHGSISVSNANGQVVLAQGSNAEYASVTQSSDTPAVTAQPSNALSTSITIEPATFGGGLLGSPIAPQGFGGPSGSGGAKQVGGFCIQ